MIERSSSVCRTWDRVSRIASSRLTGITVMCTKARHVFHCLVSAQPRKTGRKSFWHDWNIGLLRRKASTHTQEDIIIVKTRWMEGWRFNNISFFFKRREDNGLCILKGCKEWRPRWNAAKYCISSGTTLFVKVKKIFRQIKTCQKEKNISIQRVKDQYMKINTLKYISVYDEVHQSNMAQR